MKDASFNRPPVNRETTHQCIDGVIGVGFGCRRQAGVLAGRENIGMPQDFLHLLQADPSLNQMRGIAVTQAVRAELFFKPQLNATFFIAP